MKVDRPLVSIIVCCYNQEIFVEEALNSLLTQSYENLDVVIYDDASTDKTSLIIESWILKNQYKCTFIKNKLNIGLVKSINKSLKRCNGEFITFLAADDFFLKDRITNQIKTFMEIDNDYAALYSDAYVINENGEKKLGTYLGQNLQKIIPPSGDIFNDLIIYDNFIPAISVMYRLKALRSLNFYDEELLYEDYDMLLRLSKKYKIFFSKYTDVCYRFHSNNMNYMLNNSKYISSKIKILLKHMNHSKYLDEILKEKIFKLCECLFMQDSKLIFQHVKILREKHDYGKLLYNCVKFRLKWKNYLILKIILNPKSNFFLNYN